MQLLYGTSNPAKLSAMKRSLSSLPVTLLGLADLASLPADVEETGITPLENACIKARHYRDITGMTTLSADTSLYVDGLPPDRQPGVHARRMLGERMDDEQMLQYYRELAASLGGRATARYRNALCIAFADGREMTRSDDSVASSAFYLVDTPHPKRVAGFPLDALSVDIASGQYYYDMKTSRADNDLAMMDGYCLFVREALEPNECNR